MLDKSIRLVLAITIISSALLFLSQATATVTVVSMTIAATAFGQYAIRDPFG